MLELIFMTYLVGCFVHTLIFVTSPEVFFGLKITKANEMVAYTIFWPILSLILIVIGFVNIMKKAMKWQEK